MVLGPKQRTWLANPPVAARIVGGLFRSRNYVWDNDHRIVAEHDVTWTQFLTLTALRSAEPDNVLSPTQLYAATQASSGGMTKMLHGLTKAGYVTRLENPEDKRSKLVKLTQEGATLAEAIVASLIETNTELFTAILDEEECDTLARLLTKLEAGLRERNAQK